MERQAKAIRRWQQHPQHFQIFDAQVNYLQANQSAAALKRLAS
ncbi:MAG: hypothetical protein WA783_06345 [Phormidesmis sp.]